MTGSITMDRSNIITDEQSLRKIIPSYPAIMDKRIKSQLDEYALEFIHHARLAILGFSEPQLGMHYIDLKSDQFKIASDNRLTLTLNKEDLANNPNKVHCSLYFLIPGVGHGLRVNGHTVKTNLTDDTEKLTLNVYIDEVYVHCSRAIVRSKLWNPASADTSNHSNLATFNGNHESLDLNVESFIKASPFVFLKTQDDKGHCDMSPRGDPEQIVHIINQTTLLIAERAGNKVAKSMRNILKSSMASLSFLVPGVHNTLTINGRAQLTHDNKLLQPLTINKKTPKVGIIISINSMNFTQGKDGLISGDIWNQSTYKNEKELTAFSKVLSHHMNGTGLLGKASTPFINAIVKHDLKNLY